MAQKKALIICAAGMSSSMIAAKAMALLQEQGHDIFMEARGTQEGTKLVADNCYDLYLVSPQTKMYWKNLKDTADRSGANIIQIPPQAYIPIPSGIANMAKLVLDNIK
ncbi:MAG: PTS cellobiose transporter subunit IIB [Firmicutes bacterium]|nr:PTS cellobiose transporter subunit IIB [Bacillota bacterium]